MPLRPDALPTPALLVEVHKFDANVARMRAALVGRAVRRIPVGTRLCILPNHACATAAQYDRYQVIGAEGDVVSLWPRFNGW